MKVSEQIRDFAGDEVAIEELPGLAQSGRSQAHVQPEAEGTEAIVKCHARLYDLRVKDRSSAEVKAPGFSVAPVVVIRGAAHCEQSHHMRGLSARWPQVRQ